MNHPTHPEEQTFAGLVMGREAVAVEPSTLTDAVIIEIATALGINMRTGGGAIKLARAVINAQAALAAPVAAQPQADERMNLVECLREHAKFQCIDGNEKRIREIMAGKKQTHDIEIITMKELTA